jgi:TonB family protein
MVSKMLKLLLFMMMAFFVNLAVAQKSDTSLYYLTKSGVVVSTKDSADFFLFILPPDSSVDKNLFIVKEYYANGKIRVIGNSTTKTLQNIQFEGSQLVYFPNGRKMRITRFENGKPFGDVIEYYPNGKVYNIKTYNGNYTFFQQYNDSTGNVLAKDGKGHWKEFNEEFDKIDAEGEVIDGMADGNWHGRINDSVEFQSVFQRGKLFSTSRTYKNKNNDKTFTKVDIVPEFPGGFEAFGRYLGKSLRYPALARENGTQGRVIIAFVVEKDGTLSDVKIAKGIGDGCDEEALRVINNCPPWKPGIQNGKPVRVAYSVPISFALSR